jgi:predicted pyridoxine 5'-phosphate oxidase superfamily flavin-nucleotide-binding protein
MRSRFFDLAFTPAVRRQQALRGSRDAYSAMMERAADDAAPDTLSEQEIAFIAARDSFYLATVTETGWPYVQHRGGPPGFVRCLTDGALGWAEYVGNRQYVSIGNATADDRVAMLFMNYPHRQRLKLLGHMRAHDLASRSDLLPLLKVDGYRAKLERFVVVTVEAFDWNCPQHITPRFTNQEIQAIVAPLRARIAELEQQLASAAPADSTDAASPPRARHASRDR